MPYPRPPQLRYANNSNYKNDTMIRKECFVSQAVLDELRRIIEDSEVGARAATCLGCLPHFSAAVCGCVGGLLVEQSRSAFATGRAPLSGPLAAPQPGRSAWLSRRVMQRCADALMHQCAARRS